MTRAHELRGVRYGIAEAPDLVEMGQLLGEVFSRRDPPAVAARITATEFEIFVRPFCAMAATDGLTVVARSAESGRMVGALLTEDCASASPGGMEPLNVKFDPVLDILRQLGSEYWQGKTALPKECLHLFLLGVDESFGGRGVAQQLVADCLNNGALQGYRLAVTEATNRISQHIFRKQGFTERVRRSYLDHRYRGEAVFASIADHGGPILMDKSLVEPQRASSDAAQ